MGPLETLPLIDDMTRLANPNTGQGSSIGGSLGNALNLGNISQADAITAAIGIGKTIAGKIKQKKADAMLPQQEDPEERRFQRYVSRRKRAFQTGTAMDSEKTALKEALRQGTAASFRLGGGTKGLNMMARMFNEGVRNLGQQALAGESQFAGMEQQQIAKLADRKLQLNLLKYNTMQARAAQTLKEGKATTNLALARVLGVGNPYEFTGEYPQQQPTNTDPLYTQ